MHVIRRIIVVACWASTAALWILWFANSMKWIPIEIQPFEPALFLMTIVTPSVTSHWWTSKTEKNDRAEKNNRAILIDIVRKNWIRGVLEETLKDAKFDIRVDTRADQVGDPQRMDYELPTLDQEKPTALGDLINAVLRRRNERKLLNGTAQAIPQIFHNASEKLLILGAPGSGKTVLLLDLTKALLEEAGEDASKSVPVVFNLSSWAVKRDPLRAWLIVELRNSYGVGKKLAERWIDTDSLIYLLDGFDEVEAVHRQECLNRINAFMSRTRQVVICSRTNEYDLLTEKLNTNSAIELLPLEKSQVQIVFERYLSTYTVKAIMNWLSTDDAIWQEVNRPLFINILISTYAGSKPFSTPSHVPGAENQIQRLMVEPYVVQQLRNNRNHKYANDDTLRYLAWIGYNLAIRDLSQFQIEMLQGDWLSTRNPAVKSKRFFRPLLSRITVDLGWRFEYVGFRGDDFKQVVSRLRGPGKKGALIWAFFCFILLFSGASVTLVIAIIFTRAFFDILATLVNELWPFDGRRVTHRNSFNQGLGDTFKVGLSLLLGASILCGLIGTCLMTVTSLSILDRELGLTLSIIAVLPNILRTVVIGGFLPGFLIGLLLFFALIVVFGPWANTLKHALLRVLLRRKGLAPRRYDEFLELAVNRRIMRRVGGSVLFLHRYILEYFADQWERKYQREYES